MNTVLRKSWLLIPVFFMNTAFGQNLNLFQATDNPNEDENTSRRPQRASQQAAGPAFTLVGTSRFGDQFFASLLNRDGNRVKVEWEKGIVKPVEGYLNYAVVQVNSRTVSLRMPSDQPCVESEIKGVQCNGNMAVLSLSIGAPLAPSRRPNNSSPGGEDESGQGNQGDNGSEIASQETDSGFNQETIEGTNVLVRNPFSGELQTAPQLTPEEIAAREQRRQRRAEQFSDFRIERIADDEIPEGMRRVRTPFGDQLEPIEN